MKRILGLLIAVGVGWVTFRGVEGVLRGREVETAVAVNRAVARLRYRADCDVARETRRAAMRARGRHAKAYLCVTLDGSEGVRFYPDEASVPGGVTNEVYKTQKMLLRRIPARGAAFAMGSPVDEVGREPQDAGKETRHTVKLTRDFYLAIYPLTRGQARIGADVSCVGDWVGTFAWQHDERTPFLNATSFGALRGENAGLAWSGTNRVHDVDVGSLLGVMRARTGVRFDLPTEAQWEYACRAGEEAAFCDGTQEHGGMGNVGWCGGIGLTRADGKAMVPEVGLKQPNVWGIYDVHGLAWEWCLDRYVEDLGTGEVVDPCGGNAGTKRVVRGGGWHTSSYNCRSACRFGFREIGHDLQSDLGVRLMAEL